MKMCVCERPRSRGKAKGVGELFGLHKIFISVHSGTHTHTHTHHAHTHTDRERYKNKHVQHAASCASTLGFRPTVAGVLRMVRWPDAPLRFPLAVCGMLRIHCTHNTHIMLV